MPSRREFLWATSGLIGAVVLRPSRAFALPPLPAAPVKMTVYKTPTCGCCKQWVAHMEKNGFVATVHDLPNLDATKKTMGIPVALQSCHTAVIGAYWVEGHVPADVVLKALAEKPVMVGLAVPGMPAGSPGMEMGQKEAYDVLAVDKSGKTRVYARK